MERFASESEARAEFDRVDALYSAWENEEEDMTTTKTCEDRDYVCCDAYSEAAFAAEQGHALPLSPDEYDAWYTAHVARWSAWSSPDRLTP